MLLEKGLKVGGATGAEWECPRRRCPLFVRHCCCGEGEGEFHFQSKNFHFHFPNSVSVSPSHKFLS